METNQQVDTENMTPEELIAKKNQMKEYFEEALPFLSAQHQYEKMLSEISEYKYKRFHWDTQLTMAMYQMNNPEEFAAKENKEEVKEEPKNM